VADATGTDMVAFRRAVYITIQSSVSFEECAHKLMKMENVTPELQPELANMVIECCSQERTYVRFFGLLAQRMCGLRQDFQRIFEELFGKWYTTIHRLETNKLRNVAKLYSHLLFTDSINWNVLVLCSLTEADTTSSSRIFLKILMQELSEYMSLQKLQARVNDPAMARVFQSLFPKDNTRNARFAINFFTSIGLGALTEQHRAWLKAQPAQPAVAPTVVKAVARASSSSSSSDSSSSDSSDSSDSSSSS